MNTLVKLWKRPSYDGKKFTYYLIYLDEQGRRRQKSLGHTDARKAERQRTQMERELRMGFVESGSMKLSEFLVDCLTRTRGQIRESTLEEYRITMKQLIKVIGNIDYHCVQHQHGEQFIQACLDSGNRAATANKKIGTLKRMFQLAVQRRQLDENPFRYVRRPRVPRRPVSIFSEDDCTRILRASRDSNIGGEFEWGLFIFMALCTAMRRGELLNTTWTDIDFERQVICVSPKEDSKHTWQWDIKDTDRRVLPLTNELIQLLAEHQAKQPEGYPYVFIPPARYDHIQKVRMAGKWHARQRACPVGNFRRQFTLILRHAGIKYGQFHDFRRTCLTNWFTSGLSEFDVMNAAGHASFETTRRFYLAVRGDLLDRVRTASTHALQGISVANLLQVPSEAPEKKGCQTQPLDSQGLTN